MFKFGALNGIGCGEKEFLGKGLNPSRLYPARDKVSMKMFEFFRLDVVYFSSVLMYYACNSCMLACKLSKYAFILAIGGAPASPSPYCPRPRQTITEAGVDCPKPVRSVVTLSYQYSFRSARVPSYRSPEIRRLYHRAPGALHNASAGNEGRSGWPTTHMLLMDCDSGHADPRSFPECTGAADTVDVYAATRRQNQLVPSLRSRHFPLANRVVYKGETGRKLPPFCDSGNFTTTKAF